MRPITPLFLIVRGAKPYLRHWLGREYRATLASLSPKERFEYISRTNGWRGRKSVSGRGSDSDQTRHIQEHLPRLFDEFGVESVLDIPCGDFHWMSDVRFGLPIRYIGADIMEDVICANRQRYGQAEMGSREFVQKDITCDPLPKVDLVLCRDCLVHFSFYDIFRAIANVIRSDSTSFLATHFSECRRNFDIMTGEWRPINWQIPPFNFPEPIYVLNENCTLGDSRYADKSLALWKIEEIAEAATAREHR